MPVIQFPGYTKDPFGGPAGGTQQMFAAMLSSYMKTQEELKKREQEKLLAELVAGGRPDQPPGADPTGPAMNMPMPQGGYEMGPQDYPAVARSILSNPALDLKHKIAGVGAVTSMKELEPTATRQRQTKIEWWDKEGKPHAHYAAEGTENAVIADLEARGMSVGKIEKPDTPNDKIIQLKAYQSRFPEGSKEWNDAAKRIEMEEKMEAAELARKGREGKGGDSGGKTPEELKQGGRVQVGDSWYSPAELRGFWKDEYKLIDQDDPAYWQLTPEQQRSMDERVQQAPKLSDFVNQARRQGYMPGTGPLTSTPKEINKEAAATPVDDEAAKLERMTPPAGGTPPSPPDKAPDYKSMSREQAGEAALKAVGWPGGRKPTAAEVAKAKAELQKAGIR